MFKFPAGVHHDDLVLALSRFILVENNDNLCSSGVIKQIIREQDDAFYQIVFHEPFTDGLFLVFVLTAAAPGHCPGIYNHCGPARRLYRQFVDAAVGEGSDPEYYGGTDSRLLGDELFRDEVMSRLDEAEEKHSMIKKPDIAELALTVAQEMKVPIGDITGCFRPER